LFVTAIGAHNLHVALRAELAGNWTGKPRYSAAYSTGKKEWSSLIWMTPATSSGVFLDYSQNVRPPSPDHYVICLEALGNELTW